MTSSWTPIGIDEQGTIRTCFEQIYPISAAGAVTSVSAGTGITVSGTATAPVVNNAGVLSVNPGVGISLTNTAASPTINNDGVLSVAAGAGINLAGPATSPTIQNTGVLTLTAGSNITVGGTASAPTVALASPLTGPVSASVAIISSGYVQADGELIANGNFIANSGVLTVSTADTLRTNCAGTPDAPVALSVNSAGGFDGTAASAGLARRGVIRVTWTDILAADQSMVITVPLGYTPAAGAMAKMQMLASGSSQADFNAAASFSGASMLIEAIPQQGFSANLFFTVAWEIETWS